jgi:hypothetical protein
VGGVPWRALVQESILDLASLHGQTAATWRIPNTAIGISRGSTQLLHSCRATTDSADEAVSVRFALPRRCCPRESRQPPGWCASEGRRLNSAPEPRATGIRDATMRLRSYKSRTEFIPIPVSIRGRIVHSKPHGCEFPGPGGSGESLRRRGCRPPPGEARAAVKVLAECARASRRGSVRVSAQLAACRPPGDGRAPARWTSVMGTVDTVNSVPAFR